MSLVGLDIGTTGCKAVAFDSSGKPLAQARCTYRMHMPQAGACELDPREVWAAVQAVLTAVDRATRRKDPIRALGISALADCVMAVSRGGQFLSPTLLGMDSRAQAECQWLREHVGAGSFFETTGQPLYPLYPLNKILWWKRRLPSVYTRARKFLGWQDYVVAQLAGAPFVDYSLASRTGLFDLRAKSWSEDLLSACELPRTCLPEPVPSGTKVGCTGSRSAKYRGLPPGIAVVVGALDQNCAALGAGVTQPGSAADGLGTVECIICPFEGIKTTPEMLAGNFSCCPYIGQDRYATYAFNFSAGSLLDWFVHNIAAADVCEAKKQGTDPFHFVLQKIPRAPASAMVLPHFLGSGTPYLDPNSKGAILGLNIKTGRYEILKALCEAINFEIRLNMEYLHSLSITVKELRVTGRGARSNALLQLKADILGLPVHRVTELEGSCYGAAALAGFASGELNSVEDFTSRVKIEKSFFPRQGLLAHYSQRFNIYRGLYELLKHVQHQMPS